LITIKNLLKRYENLTVVDNLNLTIEKNEVFGLVGSNGAGKTTTIHMLATLLKPTSGTAKLHSLLYAVPRDIREKRIAEVLNLVGLSERKDDQVKKYSGGMRRRLEIARGLLHKPKVIFLDEPTLGLDPSSRETMWEYIQRLVKEEKITIIIIWKKPICCVIELALLIKAKLSLLILH
jgi:ABC-2 type transport system ATP-binding protein